MHEVFCWYIWYVLVRRHTASDFLYEAIPRGEPPPLLSLRSSLSSSKLRPPPKRRLTAFPSMPSIPKLGESAIVLALAFDTEVTARAMASNTKLERASCGRFQRKAQEVKTQYTSFCPTPVGPDTRFWPISSYFIRLHPIYPGTQAWDEMVRRGE
jgi:hypothetical protein